MSIWDAKQADEVEAIRRRLRAGYHTTGGKGSAKRDVWYLLMLWDQDETARKDAAKTEGQL